MSHPAKIPSAFSPRAGKVHQKPLNPLNWFDSKSDSKNRIGFPLNQGFEMTKKQEFPAFPYTPYSIQVDFMNALYQYLEKGGVSMLESPTGTGKTLSIICSALQWVMDRKERERSEATKADKVQGNDGQVCLDDEPDWMRDFIVNKDDEAQEKNQKKKKFPFRLRRHEKKKVSEGFGHLFLSGPEDVFDAKKQTEASMSKNHVAEPNDEEFLLEGYESEEESHPGRGKSKRKSQGAYDSSSDGEEEDEEEGSDEEEEGLKVYFCSRTHSQLSQFVKELRKTIFANEIKLVCLGSRKNFCINEDVQKLRNSTQISERCLELQKNKKSEISKMKNLGTKGRIRRTKASTGCPMLRQHKLQREFKDEVFQQGAMDIEDLVQLGRGMGTCPYYGSRRMVPAADLVVLPYQSLLSKLSRESLGLKLKKNIVIIDEAHNLADSLISMYDAKITFSQLETVQCNLEKYLGRFRNLLGAGNRRYIQTLLVLTRALLKPLVGDKNLNCVNEVQDTESPSEKKPSCDYSMAINNFLFSLNIDNINLFKLLEYVKESNIIHKVSGYGERVAMLLRDLTQEGGKSYEEVSSLSSFRAFTDMLLALTNNDGDGRIIISTMRSTTSGQHEGYLKYVMLTGEKIFSEIVNEAHAVILAGGTLQPIEETRERLFPWLQSNQLQFFSCNHIVPPESILPVAVSHGPSGHSFDFSYSSRGTSTMIQELGLLISNLVAVIPEGMVVFFSSFEYEAQVYGSWKTSGILNRIMKKKMIFREPRKNTDVEVVLRQYREAIEKLSTDSAQNRNGAIMLAVVGGKISEGINFSDGMCRCIVMVGLPYPSPSDIELLERIKHIEGLGDSNSSKTSNTLIGDSDYSGEVQAGFSVLRCCRRRGKEYYENLCLKAVNQSIGRAIRHINDYAAILLVDARYSEDPSKSTSSSHPTNKLPKWIKDHLFSSTKGYGEVHRLLHQFFKHNKNRGEGSQ